MAKRPGTIPPEKADQQFGFTMAAGSPGPGIPDMKALQAENRLLMDQLATARQVTDTLGRDQVINSLIEMLKAQQKLTADMFAEFMQRATRG
jgi:hypothetical protein